MSSRSMATFAVASLAVAALALGGCSNSQKDSDKQVNTATGVSAPSATATTSASSASSSASTTAEGVSFNNAYIRAKGTDRNMTAIFGEIVNNTDHAVTLEGFSSEALGDVTYQLHEVVNGVMQEHEGGFEIPAHSTFTLQPGGDHLMVMNVERAIEAGDTIDLTLKFDGADDVTVPSLAIRTSASGGENYGSNGNLQGEGGMSSSATTSASH
ncbi:MAG: copper chaperone PCu(A)C [Corynebacterium sp.]|nr:copper chaperone PCu(A)C [Corynebacterium sp.]